MRTLMIATIVLLAACGTNAVPLYNYSDAFHEAFCRYLTKCGDVENVDTCKELNLGFTFRLSASVADAIDIGKIGYSGENAQKCFDALAARSCDVTSQSGRVLPEACREIVLGTEHDGAACALDAECISQACDVPACNMACCTGTCTGDTAPGRAKAGESCANEVCDDTSFCDGAIMMCVALKPADAFCTSPLECAYGLDCLQTGTCGALPGPGDACTGPCRDEGTTCSPTSRTCVKVALGGAACTTSAECSPLYTCDATKHCSAGPALGAACTIGQRCGTDRAFCDVPMGQAMGTCVLPKADDAPCQRNADCDSQRCDLATLVCGPEPVCL